VSSPGLPTRDIPAGITAEQATILAAQATYQAQQEQLRAQLAAAVIAIWASVAQGGNFSPTEAAIWVERILPISLGAQRAMTAITVARLNQLHAPPQPIIVLPQVGEAIRGRAPEQVYARPFNEIRWRLSQGKTVEQAVRAGQRRAISIATTDLQLAQTQTAQRYMADSAKRPAGPKGKIVGYRRVLSSNPNHCALCMIASTQRYSRAKLMAIHPGCGCTVMPIWGDSDPGLVLNERYLLDVHDIVERDLGEKYRAADARSGVAAYRNIIITHEHGELGPVLGVRDHDYTGPNDIRRLGHQRVNPLPEPEDVVDLDAL
jgi:hypothetical protein